MGRKTGLYLCSMTLKRLFVLRFVWVIFLLTCAQSTVAQLKVDPNISIQDAITRLVGSGVRVTNIRVNCPSSKGRPYGYFTDNTGTLGMDDGLVITTGAATNAVGPNNSASKTQSNKNEEQDSDLASIVQGAEKQFDACIIEFDVEVFADTLTFDFVFGSEEYLEFIKDYHDVFGFFISGPGITGKLNLATLPGTQTTISVENVNTTTNSSYYIGNGTGSTPYENLFLQYDGFTKRLESKVSVIPCSKYSLKLAICDIKDDIYDAGIFIAGKSLKTKAPKIDIRYQYPIYSTAIEGCNGAFVKVTRQSGINEAIAFLLRYRGTALKGIDYGSVPDSIRFLPGESEKEFFIPVFEDGLKENEEGIEIQLLNPCPGLPVVDQKTVSIKESFEFEMQDEKICFGDSVQLNPSPASGFRYTWSPGNYLSCSACPRPFASPPVTSEYIVVIQDTLSGCKAIDTMNVKVEPIPTASFTLIGKGDYSSLDIFFTNTSENADVYRWDFGDGASSVEKDPLHYYVSGFDQDSVSYTIQMFARNSELGCGDSASARVSIGNPLFIPNLITANDDGLNDAFFVRGIQPGFWKIEVFDRWGKLVFEDKNYKLDWKGEGLTSGYYFFQLYNSNRDRKYSGWVGISK